MTNLKIFVIPGTYNYSNMGDTAMLFVALRRLYALFPDAQITTFSLNPAYIKKYFPTIATIGIGGRNFWSSTREVFSPFSVKFSSFTKLDEWLRFSEPCIYLKLLGLRGKLLRRNYPLQDIQNFLSGILNSNLLIVSGMGGIHDGSMRPYALFKIIELALRKKIPIALLGQGVGPVHDEAMFKRASTILPQVDLITIREDIASLPLLISLNVDRTRIIVTGDDAIEMAYHGRHEQNLGRGIGIGIRVSSSSQVEEADLIKICRIVQEAATELEAELIPVAIMNVPESGDSDAIKFIVPSTDGGKTQDTPEKVIAAVSRCRVVIAGSYHASVFALSQGIPTIGLAKTEYYYNKLKGVNNQFGDRCEVIDIGKADFPERLSYTLKVMWEKAEVLRPALLESAKNQIRQGRDAYAQLKKYVHSASN